MFPTFDGIEFIQTPCQCQEHFLAQTLKRGWENPNRKSRTRRIPDPCLSKKKENALWVAGIYYREFESRYLIQTLRTSLKSA